MSDQSSLPISTLPDGGAELHVVLHLRWEDIAALGREAGRLAAQLKRPVSLDEAASQKLSTRRTSTAASKERTEPAATASRMALASSAPAEQAREWASGSAATASAASRSTGGTTSEVRGPFDPPAKLSSLAGTAADPGRATG
ncbi:hypothetical protein ABZ746_05660 [Streptomyces sp. NPDC020096]|jgi:hypothetical protein